MFRGSVFINKKKFVVNNLLFKKSGLLFGTEGGTRTHTLLPTSDFESDASTSSATPAARKGII